MSTKEERKRLVPYDSEMIRTPSPLKKHLRKMFKEYKDYMAEQYRNAKKADSVMLLEYPDQWLEKLTTQWFERYKASNAKGVQSAVVYPEPDLFQEFLNHPAYGRIPRDYLEYVYKRGVDNYDPDQLWCPLQQKVIVWYATGYKLFSLHDVDERRTPRQLDLEEFERGYSRIRFPIRNAHCRPRAVEAVYDKDKENRVMVQLIKRAIANPDDPFHTEAKSGALEAKYGISLSDYPDEHAFVSPTYSTHRPQGFSLLGADPQELLRMALDPN